ncbi:MAG: DNA-processing protein DprA [bacterium]|nr:DNA-processing protein DprA [bacterium]
MNYWLALHSIPDIGPVTFNKLLDKFGTPEKVFSATRYELMQIPRLSEAIINLILCAKLPCYRTTVPSNNSKIILELKNRQFELITKYDKRYPELLKNSTVPPPIIYVYGKMANGNPFADRHSLIAIIGARNASRVGLNKALEFGKYFAHKGFSIVSGYAKGIDTYAHLGAIIGGGKTIMVLPVGVLNFVVHKELEYMREKLFSQSIIFSEFYPSAGWLTGQAMLRNRRISELSKAVVVIEPGVKGGTIATTKWAKKLNKPIFIYEKLFATRKKEFLELGAMPIEKPEEIIACLNKE